MMTPAETAVVSLTPEIMNTVNRKLPRKDSKNTSPRVWRVSGGSSAGLRSQCAMATPPMPKRSQASRKTGNTTARGLVSAT